jgi:catechol 2,3-dioxygenase-like lactoylglutathione lyase family enzyme
MGKKNAPDSEVSRAAATVPSSQPTAASALHLGQLFGVLVQVKDLEQSLSFYRDVLGLRVEQNDGMVALLSGADAGVRTLALRQVGPRATHYLGGTGVSRIAWQVRSSAELDLAEQQLQRHGVRYDRPSGETVDSIVTADPDGLSVVLLTSDARSESPPARLYAWE